MKYSIFLVAISGFFLFQEAVLAQNQIQLSFFPGYHAINTDEISSGSQVSKTNMIFGGTASVRTIIKGIPTELSIGYSEGVSTVYSFVNYPSTQIRYNTNLKYQTVPIEALWIFPADRKIGFLAGINIAAQHRTLIFENTGIPSDRLLSFGVGLSGKMHMSFGTFASGKGTVFGNLHARWTEFIFHDANGRNLNDYTLRHVTVSPQLGVAWGLD